jgi:hypothetical protein
LAVLGASFWNPSPLMSSGKLFTTLATPGGRVSASVAAGSRAAEPGREQADLMKLAGLTNPISEAWRRASREDRREYVQLQQIDRGASPPMIGTQPAQPHRSPVKSNGEEKPV